MCNVLLLDDSSDNLFNYGRVLKHLGCTVTETNDPIKALQMLRYTSPQFDIVFTDFYMPKVNGLLFLQQVKSAYPDIPVVLTSAVSNPDVQVQAFSRGASFCMFEQHQSEDFRMVLEKLFPEKWQPSL
jgi:CheY-like chemotaxis protein